MAYAKLGAKSDGDTFDTSDWTQIKDNFDDGVPDVFTAKGGLAAADAADSVVEVAVGSDGDALMAHSGCAAGMCWQSRPAVRVYNSGNIDPATSTWVGLTYDSERFDAGGMHAANSGCLAVPTGGSGVYLIGGNVLLDCVGGGVTGGGGAYGMRILLNPGGASAVVGQFGPHQLFQVGYDVCMGLETAYKLADGDEVCLQVFTTSNIDVLATGNYSPEFYAAWVSASPA